MRDIEAEIQRDPDMRQQAFALMQSLAERHAKLNEINQKLAAAHGISAVEQHKILILRLQEIMLRPSAVSLSSDNWRIPRDAESWKKTREEQLEPIYWRVSDLLGRLDSALTNETFMEALRVADPEGRFPDAFMALYTLQEIVAAAANIRSTANEGESPRGGNRPNPDWIREFGRAAQGFWYTFVSQKGTRPRFVAAGDPDEGGNAITKWMIDLYRSILPVAPKNYATFRTELSHLPAYTGNRPADDSS